MKKDREYFDKSERDYYPENWYKDVAQLMGEPVGNLPESVGSGYKALFYYYPDGPQDDDGALYTDIQVHPDILNPGNVAVSAYRFSRKWTTAEEWFDEDVQDFFPDLTLEQVKAEMGEMISEGNCILDAYVDNAEIQVDEESGVVNFVGRGDTGEDRSFSVDRETGELSGHVWDRSKRDYV